MNSKSRTNKTKSITLVFSDQLEVQSAAKNRALSFINEFLLQDYHVILVSSDEENYCLLSHSNFIHHKVKTKDSKISSFIKRGLIEGYNAYQILKASCSFNSSVVLVSIPSMFLLHLSVFLPKSNIAILDIRDLSWEYLSENSFITKSIKKMFQVIAEINFKRYDVISMTNDKEFEYIEQITNTQTLIKIPNGVSQNSYDTLIKTHKNESQIKTVTYIGNVGLAQDLSTLLCAAEKLPYYHFNIVGSGTDMPRIQSLCENLNLKNIQIWGRQSFDDLINIYSNSDIVYAQLAPEYAGAMPSKLYEYLATGKYIIFGGEGIAADALKKCEHVSIIPPQNADILAKTIDELFQQHYTRTNTINANNRVYIKNHFIREISVQKLFKFL